MEQVYRAYVKGENEKSRGIPVLTSPISLFSSAREKVLSDAYFFIIGDIECGFCALVIIPPRRLKILFTRAAS